MNTYKRHRFPPDIISYAVWLYYRFNLSHRDIEDLLAERGITVSREAIRLWCIKFGALYARRLSRRHQGYGDTFFIDEVFVKLNGKQHYLWRAVDHEGEVLESYVTKTRDKQAALIFLKKALKRYGAPRLVITDRLRSYGAAMKDIGNQDRREVGRHHNNRAENSQLPFRRRERAMSRFRRMSNLQKFVSTHASFHNHFNLDRHINHRSTFKSMRNAALSEWRGLLAG